MKSEDRHQLDRPRGRPLVKWQYEFAAWWVEQPGRPSVAQQEAVASALARQSVSYKQIKLLKRQEEFVAYADRLRQGARARAAAKFEAHLPSYIDAHQWACEKAVEAGDYRAVPPITTPALDRVWPKRVEQTPSSPQHVVITLTPAQLKEEDAEYIPVEVVRLSDDGEDA